MMVKDATTRKTWLPASVTFWVSLLVSSAGINGLSLQAIAAVSQPASSVETSAEASTVNQITPVAEISSGKGDINSNPVPGTVSATFPTTAEISSDKGDTNNNPVPGTVSAPFPTTAEISSDKGDINTNPVPGTVSAPFPTTAEISSGKGDINTNPVPGTVSAPFPTTAEISSDKGDINTNPVPGTVPAPFSTTAERSSDKGNINTNSVQDRVSMPPVAPLEDNPVESSAELPTLDDVPSVAELSSGEGNMESNDSMSQVTNVTQLRDVSPGDWAFEALRSLVERYGCIAGYPDGTYRGK